MPAPKYDWTKLDPKILDHVRHHGPTWTPLALALGMPPGSLRNRVRRALGRQVAAAERDWAKRAPADPGKAFQAERERLRSADQTAALRAMLKAAARETTLEETLVALIEDTVPRLPPATPAWAPPPRTKEAPVEETVVQFFSDWHLYERVSAERTRGLAEYSAEIGAARVAQSVASHASIVTKLRRSGWAFPELVVVLGGDFHPGTIHELERHASDGANAVLSTFGCAWVLAHALRDLGRLYPSVHVVGVPGNHGRLPDARRVQQKDPTRNWDYLVYLLARQMLSDQGHFHFWFPDSYAAQVDIRGWQFLVTHGHDIKSWNSIPHYGIARFVQNTNAVEAARANVLHYVLLAHFHEHSTLPHAAGEVLVNGSVIGPTEFGVNALGRAAGPHQLMFGVHREHGVTHRWPLRLDRPAKDLPAWGVAPWREVQGSAELGVQRLRVAA
jgi:hypothetical protein